MPFAGPLPGQRVRFKLPTLGSKIKTLLFGPLVQIAPRLHPRPGKARGRIGPRQDAGVEDHVRRVESPTLSSFFELCCQILDSFVCVSSRRISPDSISSPRPAATLCGNSWAQKFTQ